MRYLLALLFCSLLLSSNAQSPEPTMTDPRDKKTYKTITIRRSVGMDVIYTHTWLAENLNFEMEGSFCYYEGKGPVDANCNQYGRLYTWEAALAACPPGWHLPSDLEWQRLIHQFTKGGLISDDEQGDKMAYRELLEGGSSRFNAQLGGVRDSDGVFGSQGLGAAYWSSSAQSSERARGFNFDSSDRSLYLLNEDKTLGFSCRCVRDN